MARPFTAFHACRYVLLWLLVIAGVYGVFLLLTHARPHTGLAPSKVSFYGRSLPGRGLPA